MNTIIKPSAAIRQSYNDISKLCKETGAPIFLTKNGEGDLVVMDINAYDQREKQLELREKLIEVEELRKLGVQDIPDKYRVTNFGPHLWFVFQVKENEQCVKIEYIIDDRQNYGAFLK